MDRRNFLRNLIGGVVAGAAVRTFPFRVFSFPSEITMEQYLGKAMEEFAQYLNGAFPPLWGMAYHNDVPPVGPWLNLERSSYKDLVDEFGIAPDLGTRLNFKLPKRSMIVTKVDQKRGEITLASA